MSRTLKYKSYDGSILYSPEDKMLHGCILLTRDCVSYGGNNLEELEKNFRDATDEYLAFCETEGKQPNQPATTKHP